MQKPRQHRQVNGHRRPHRPQLLLSEVTSMQRFLQHRRVGGNSPWLHIQGLFQHPGSRGSHLSFMVFFSHGDDDEPPVIFCCTSTSGVAFPSPITYCMSESRSKQAILTSTCCIVLRCATKRQPGRRVFCDIYIYRWGEIPFSSYCPERLWGGHVFLTRLGIEVSCCRRKTWCGLSTNYVIGKVFLCFYAWRTLLALTSPWLKQGVTERSTSISPHPTPPHHPHCLNLKGVNRVEYMMNQPDKRQAGGRAGWQKTNHWLMYSNSGYKWNGPNHLLISDASRSFKPASYWIKLEGMADLIHLFILSKESRSIARHKLLK